MAKTKIRTRTSGAHKGKRYPIENQGPQGYSIAKGNPTSKGVTREDLRNARTLKASKKFRVSWKTRTNIRDMSIVSPPQPKSIHATHIKKKWDKKRDASRLNKRVLDPTNPQHLDMWRKNPGKYDLADVDTPFRDDDEITLFRGMGGQYYVRDPEERLFYEYNKVETGLGLFWTGNINVARIYAVHARKTSVPTISDLRSSGRGLSGLDEEIKEKIKTRKKEISPPYYGVILKYQAKGQEIASYNPEGIPFEMEARMEKNHRDTILKSYPGLEIGFVQETGDIAWHKVETRHRDMTFQQISKEKSYKLEKLEPIKATKSKITQEYYVTGKSSGAVKVATKPPEKTEGK